MKYDLLCLCVLSLVVFKTAHARSAAGNLCANWKQEDGAGFRSHPADCDQFIQCQIDEFGLPTEKVGQCAFSTHWDNSVFACVPVSQAACYNNKCKAKDDGYVFAAKGNCRGYWQCTGNIPEAKCCPIGQEYDNNLGCIDSLKIECNATCFNENATLANDNSTANTTKVKEVIKCDFRVSKHPGKYQQNVVGHGWIDRDCPAGTTFNETSCLCAQSASNISCKVEVHLPFTNDVKDISAFAHYVSNRSVELTNGFAKFNGFDSRLTIPRFTNLDRSNAIAIKIKYESDYTEAVGSERIIFSNGACVDKPSIQISENASNIHFFVNTSEMNSSVSVPRLSSNDIELFLFDGVLTGKNGLDSNSAVATGFLENTRCAFHIGEGSATSSRFVGKIDELEIYLCNPATRATPLI